MKHKKETELIKMYKKDSHFFNMVNSLVDSVKQKQVTMEKMYDVLDLVKIGLVKDLKEVLGK